MVLDFMGCARVVGQVETSMGYIKSRFVQFCPAVCHLNMSIYTQKQTAGGKFYVPKRLALNINEIICMLWK